MAIKFEKKKNHIHPNNFASCSVNMQFLFYSYWKWPELHWPEGDFNLIGAAENSEGPRAGVEMMRNISQTDEPEDRSNYT